MKVLCLPNNTSSLPAITVEALNKINNVNAKYLVQDKSNKYDTMFGPHVYLPKWISKRKVFKWLHHKIFAQKRLKRLIEEADVLHYFYSSALDSGKDLRWAMEMKKPVFIEWLGSDIRNPEITRKINKHYTKTIAEDREYSYLESDRISLRNQQLFAKFNGIPVLCPEMTIYLKKEMFPESHVVLQRFNTKDYTPYYPDANKKRPLVVHAPTSKSVKGSKYVIAAVEKLKQQYDFDFKLITNVTRDEVFAITKSADIFIDQLIVGGYGMAAIEAMCFGKPVMCYIMNEVFDHGLPVSCPIVNVNPENIEERLASLLADPVARCTTGVKSRQYVEEFHDADKLAIQLMSIYQKALDRLR